MATGKASVATSVNGAPELVEDGISGFLVDSENVDQLFDKLSKLLLNDKLRTSMESKALQRVKDHFTFDKTTDNLELLINQQIKANSIK
jgi:glycosyltransferase involved in cell wall biosynthesis